MILRVPDFCLLLLVGPAGSGKSTLAACHFLPTEVLSSDRFRAMITDREEEQGASGAAFSLLHQLADLRLSWRRFTVVDATNLHSRNRRELLRLAARRQAETVALVLDLPPGLVRQRNQSRHRQVSEEVLTRQIGEFRAELAALEHEGYAALHRLRDPAEVEALRFERVPLPVDRRSDAGPFDLVGDIHGCYDELVELLTRLGYRVAEDGSSAEPPPGRRALFLGDLVDRGPSGAAVLRLVMGMVEAGAALCLPGNHDDKLMRALQGREVQTMHGLAETLDQVRAEGTGFCNRVRDFLASLPSHYVLDGGSLVAAHAGLRENLQNRDSRRVRDFCLYGDPTGKLDEFGLPVRRDWAREYAGTASVVYGHTPVPEPTWCNQTINLDTGCVFGGRLTALAWPERTLTSVPARATWCESPQGFAGRES